jgi:hypothetical protein
VPLGREFSWLENPGSFNHFLGKAMDFHYQSGLIGKPAVNRSFRLENQVAMDILIRYSTTNGGFNGKTTTNCIFLGKSIGRFVSSPESRLPATKREITYGD